MMELNIQLFASTNKTANYELPQFVGTDKPTWLGDFNSAMADIDAGMAENASDISAMESDVATATSTASQASQDVSSLTSTVNTLSSNVQSATTTANNASSTASSALNTANTANGKADTNATNIATNTSDIQALNTALSKFNLTNNSQVTWNITGGTVTANNIRVATNSDGSIGKIYGRVQFTKSATNTTLSCASNLRPTEAITINALGTMYSSPSTTQGYSVYSAYDVNIATDGTITFSFNIATSSALRGMLVLHPCLLFMTNFGDTPTTNGE